MTLKQHSAPLSLVSNGKWERSTRRLFVDAWQGTHLNVYSSMLLMSYKFETIILVMCSCLGPSYIARGTCAFCRSKVRGLPHDVYQPPQFLNTARTAILPYGESPTVASCQVPSIVHCFGRWHMMRLKNLSIARYEVMAKLHNTASLAGMQIEFVAPGLSLVQIFEWLQDLCSWSCKRPLGGCWMVAHFCVHLYEDAMLRDSTAS